MIKIGLTGSIASGKTTASRIISKKKGPLFIADEEVKKLYKKKFFKTILKKRFDLKINDKFKDEIKKKILIKRKNLVKLEKLVHPFVRKEMLRFSRKNKNNKFIFFEIPLLVESKLTKFFDTIIFVKSKETLRRKRYKLKGGTDKLFSLLNSHQFNDKIKMKFCDHIVVNNGSLSVLKKKLRNIINIYE